VKLDELLALCLVLGTSPIDMLVPSSLDDSQQYAVTPTTTADVSDTRAWIRGEAFLVTYKGQATGLYSPRGRPTAAEIAAACTRTRTSPSSGTGWSTSSSLRPSGWRRTARTTLTYHTPGNRRRRPAAAGVTPTRAGR